METVEEKLERLDNIEARWMGTLLHTNLDEDFAWMIRTLREMLGGTDRTGA